MGKIFLCAISNVSSGSCNEDCRFCTQSVRHGADIARYYQKPISQIVEDARAARTAGAVGFCLVTAGKGLSDAMLPYITEAAKAVKAAEPELAVIACNGTATARQLETLKAAGVDAYNHNLETSEAYYPAICSTHDWQERLETCRQVKAAGLKLISGGIVGMGERMEDRKALFEAIAGLEPFSMPLNFFHPNPALPLKVPPMEVDEALAMIRLARATLPGGSRLMIAGGREVTFKERQPEIFEAGANAIVIGNYLTTPGNDPGKDRAMIESLGLTIAKRCNE